MGRVATIAEAWPIPVPSPLRPALVAAPLLAATAALPPGARDVCALAAMIALGVPHGALDGEIARPLLRPRLGRAWFPLFAAPYLALSALVLLAWHWAPMATLAAFLAASAWHFGSEDAPGTAVEAAARGGLPVAVPLLVHPAATWAVFATASGLLQNPPLGQPPDWLRAAAIAWLALAAAWAGIAALRGQGRSLLVPALVASLFVALPPLTAFAIYFVCVHAPAHTAALIRHPARAPRVRDGRTALVRALPLTGLTLLIGAGLWPLYAGPLPGRLLSLTLQGLAALTLPHMLLDAWATALDGAGTRRRGETRVPRSAVL